MPQQERAQDQLAQRELLGHDHPHLLNPNPQYPSRGARHRTEVCPLAGEHADFSEELRLAVGGDHPLVWLAVVLGDPSLAGQHHDQVVCLIAVGKQHLPGGHLVLAAVPAQHLKLRCVQDRVAAGLHLLRSRCATAGRARRGSRSGRTARATCALLHRDRATPSTTLAAPILAVAYSEPLRKAPTSAANSA